MGETAHMQYNEYLVGVRLTTILFLNFVVWLDTRGLPVLRTGRSANEEKDE